MTLPPNDTLGMSEKTFDLLDQKMDYLIERFDKIEATIEKMYGTFVLKGEYVLEVATIKGEIASTAREIAAVKDSMTFWSRFSIGHAVTAFLSVIGRIAVTILSKLF